jgi:carboxymethylenebutenolidase
MTTKYSAPPRYRGLISETVRYTGHNGDTIRGQLTRPIGEGPFGAVIVVHEAFGLNLYARECARRIAEAGYITLAPDFYTRWDIVMEGLVDVAEIRAMNQAMGGGPSDAQIVGDMEASAAYLQVMPQANGKVGSIGFCWGGRVTVLHACNTKRMAGAVDCWGGRVIAKPDQLTPQMPKAVFDMLPGLSCPVLGIYGADDYSPTVAENEQLEAEMKRLGKPYEAHTYEGAGHAFFNFTRPNFRAQQADQGWTEVYNFFAKHLG